MAYVPVGLLAVAAVVRLAVPVTTLAESPVRAGILWAGTDDGNVQVTRDDGKTWTNVVQNVPGVPNVASHRAAKSAVGVLSLVSMPLTSDAE